MESYDAGIIKTVTWSFILFRIPISADTSKASLEQFFVHSEEIMAYDFGN